MKKFKNNINVKGFGRHIEAFIGDLITLGYEDLPGNITRAHIINKEEILFVYKTGKFSSMHMDNSHPTYTLPDQWSEALKAAAEVEEEAYKEGDWVLANGYDIVREGNGFSGRVFSKLYPPNMDGKKTTSGMLPGEAEFCVFAQGRFRNILKSHIERKATEEEIKNHLIEEANKKGFVVGARFRHAAGFEYTIEGFKLITDDATDTTGSELTSAHFKTHGIHLAICFSRSCLIPLERTTLVPSHPSITINGYEAKFEDWGLDFNNGCAKIDKYLIKNICHVINNGYENGNKNITSVKIGAGEFTADQIKEIAEYYAGK